MMTGQAKYPKGARALTILGAFGLLTILLMIGCSPAAPADQWAATDEPSERDSDGGEEFNYEEAELTDEPYYAEATEESEMEEPPAISGPAGEAAGPSQDGEGQGDDPEVPQPQERMIIKNGEMSLLVENTDTAIDQITAAATDNGGYVLSSQAWFSGEYKAATITIAVRSDRFETAMRRLRDISIEVLSETASGEDVSTEFVDLESRLRNLEATRDRIMDFLDKARTVEEALEINAQLAEIEAEIEQVKGRMTYLSGRAAFSTITINVEVPQPTATPSPTPTQTLTPTPTFTPTPWSPGGALDNAVKTQTSLFQGLVDTVIWISVVLGPYLVAVAFIGLGVRVWQHRRNGKGGGTSS